MTKPVFRFAPSPNGELHLGHAFSALTDHALCRAADGRFLIRIEDIDLLRCRPEYDRQALEDLAWLGILWEEPIRRQSEHFDDYRKALEKLMRRGLVYPAFMSRGEIKARVDAEEKAGRQWPRDPDGAPLYPGDDRHLDGSAQEALIAEGRPYSFRLRMAEALAAVGAPLAWDEEGAGPAGERGRIEAAPEAWGDVILARREIPTSYHLAVVVDDAAQRVSHVVRGRDLFHATSVHRLLQALIGLPAPRYHHHRLILDETGRKLSKSFRDTSLRSLRLGGATPDDIRRMVGLEPEAHI